MDALLSIEFVCTYSRQELFLVFNLENDHISIQFHYNAYAMIGNDFDMVNCYGFMSHMTFEQHEYNLDHFQCDSVQTHPNRE
jgi:hypothetical protein